MVKKKKIGFIALVSVIIMIITAKKMKKKADKTTYKAKIMEPIEKPKSLMQNC